MLLLAVNVASAFVISPIMVRELGNTGYGVWEVLFGIVGYLGLLDLGVGPAIVRFVARAKGSADNDELRRIASSCFPFLTGVGILGGAVLGFVALRADFFFNVDRGAIPDLTAAVAVVALSVAIEFPASLVVAHLMGTQRHYFLNASKILLTVAQTVGFYFVLLHSANAKLLGIAMVLLAYSLIHTAAITVFVRVTDRDFVVSRRYFSWRVLRDMYGFGIKNMVLMMAQRLRKQTMSIVIAHVLGVAHVVFFAIPGRLVEYANSLALAMGFPLTPFFADIAARDDTVRVRHAWFQSSRVLQLVMFGAVLGLFALGEAFLGRWMGQEYAREGRWVLRLLTATLALDALSPSSQRLLLSLGKHGAAAKIALALSIINVALSIPAARIWGISGIAMTVLVTAGLTTVLMMRMACRALGVSVRHHLLETAWRFRFPVLAGGAAFALLATLPWSNGYGSIVARGALGGGTYLATAWFFALDAGERRRLLAGASRGLQREGR